MARTKQSPRDQPLLNYSDATPTRTLRTRQITIPQKPKYTCSCGSDVAGGQSSQCRLNRCIEPLAWNIEPDSVVAQTESPLFTTIPTELRSLIFEYALTNSRSEHPGQVELNMASTPRRPRQAERSQQRDIARNLLLTCRAVYLETYLLPITLNPVQFPHFDAYAGFKPRGMLPWQFANIQALDITVQQIAIEGDCLANFIYGPNGCQPTARHKGVYVAPYMGLRNSTGVSGRDCEFNLLPAETNAPRIRLTDALAQMDLYEGFEMPLSEMRLHRAKLLIHLTLRIPARNWWTWTADPTSTNATHHHLGLDPAVGDGSVDLNSRPTCTKMQELAQQRRNEHHPPPPSRLQRLNQDKGWAHVISKLPDIKTLELVLETFSEKKAQLDAVVGCAQTWRFPILNSQHELAWDGRIEESTWSTPVVEDSQLQEISRNVNPARQVRDFQQGYWYARSSKFEVRVVRFSRRQVVRDAGRGA